MFFHNTGIYLQVHQRYYQKTNIDSDQEVIHDNVLGSDPRRYTASNPERHHIHCSENLKSHNLLHVYSIR